MRENLIFLALHFIVAKRELSFLDFQRGGGQPLLIRSVCKFHCRHVSSFFIPEKNSHSAHMIRLNYRPSLRERAATTSTSIDAVDLDVLNFKLKRNTSTTSSSRRAGRFRYFGNRRIHQMHPSASDDSVAPVEVNITKTTQMHTDDKPTRSLKTLSIEFRKPDTETAYSDSY